MWLWIALVIIAAIAALIALAALIGSRVPKRHIAARTAHFNQPVEAIWEAITDHANEPSWRTDLTTKARLPDRNGREMWLETHKHGDNLTLETVERNPPSGGPRRTARLVGRIADEKLPFSGTWTYELVSDDHGRGCSITIIEDGEVHNSIFRFAARFVIGYHGTIEKYLAMLAAKFNEPLRIDRSQLEYVDSCADKSPA